MKIFSLFSGIGGFDLALRNLGHEIVGACEIDSYARQIYARHFPNVTIHHDATTLSPDALPHFDLLCGGFPCQAFSVAGKRRGFDDCRGTMFFEIARIAKEKRPRYLLLENVRGLLSHNKGETFRTILQTLDDVGYDAEWQVLNSKYFVPQNRERIFIVGHLRGERTRQVFPIGGVYGEDKEEVKGGGQECQTVNCIDSNYYKGIDNHGQRTLVRVGNVDTKGHNSIWGRVYDPDGISSTLNSEGGGLGAKTGLYAISHTKANLKQRYQERDSTWTLDTSGGKMAVEDKTRIRRLTPLECERLQGFPDGWTEGLSDTQRYKCIGNAVTVPVVEYIMNHMTGDSS